MLAQSPPYFAHDADIGIIGRGATLEQAFEVAAQAVFGIMTRLENVQPETTITIEFEETDRELALVTWLNLLLGPARASAAGTLPRAANTGTAILDRPISCSWLQVA